MPRAPDHSSRLVARRYRLHGVVGEGGFGRVYRATDERLDTAVAVKIINPWWAEDPEWVERFAQEARTAAAIRHPGVVRVTDTGVDPKIGPYTVAELVDGTSLRDLIDRRGALGANEAVDIVAQAATALAAAHDLGIVHRDVKPSNLLIDSAGRVRVCDFGIARLQTGATKSSAAHTLVGTPAYMAPEQARGKAAGPAADQYALGVVLFELLAGKVPFDGDTPVAVAMAHVSDEPPGLPEGTPTQVASAVLRSLNKDPAERFAGCRELAAALVHGDATQALRHETPTSPTSRVPRRARSQADNVTRAATRRRRRWPLPAGALIAVIALGAMAAVMLGRGGDPAAAPAATNSVTEQTTAPNNDRPSNPDAPAKPAPDPTPTRIVPVLTGLSRSGARARARHHGLAVQITPARSIRIAAGIVARQHPNAGAKVDEGDTIRLTVSTGPPPIEVPDLAGASLTDVQATLASLGLRYTTTAVPSSRDAGSVVSTHPSAGSTVHAGDSIAVSVARAKAWRTVGTYTLTADGSTPSYRITGRKWRLTYTMSSCDVCPFLEIKGGEYEQVDLAEGTHTSYGPGGRGSYRLVANSVGSTGYDLQVIVEQFS